MNVNAPSPSVYVQRYDRRGYPENRQSKELSRRLRRAQNDILASVGICVDVKDGSRVLRRRLDGFKGRPLDSSKVKLAGRENVAGFFISGQDNGLFWLSHFCVLGFRQRFQVCKKPPLMLLGSLLGLMFLRPSVFILVYLFLISSRSGGNNSVPFVSFLAVYRRLSPSSSWILVNAVRVRCYTMPFQHSCFGISSLESVDFVSNYLQTSSGVRKS